MPPHPHKELQLSPAAFLQRESEAFAREELCYGPCSRLYYYCDAVLPIRGKVYFPYRNHLCQVWPNDLFGSWNSSRHDNVPVPILQLRLFQLVFLAHVPIPWEEHAWGSHWSKAPETLNIEISPLTTWNHARLSPDYIRQIPANPHTLE